MADKIKGYIISEETTSSNPVILSDKPTATIFETILQDGDKPNRNKRVYPTSVLKKAFENDYIKERLATKTWYGEAGHPLNPDVQRQLYIDQTRISHIITKAWFEGNLIKAIVECAPTAVGRDMQGLIRCGSQVAFSMRGLGPISEKKGDIIYVKEPLQILTYDWIIHPSHAKAYMQNIISESADITLAETKPFYIPITDKQIIDYIKSESTDLGTIMEQMEFEDTTNMSYNPKTNMVTIKEGKDMLALYLEKNIQNDINDYLASLDENQGFYNYYDVTDTYGTSTVTRPENPDEVENDVDYSADMNDNNTAFTPYKEPNPSTISHLIQQKALIKDKNTSDEYNEPDTTVVTVDAKKTDEYKPSYETYYEEYYDKYYK